MIFRFAHFTKAIEEESQLCCSICGLFHLYFLSLLEVSSSSPSSLSLIALPWAWEQRRGCLVLSLSDSLPFHPAIPPSRSLAQIPGGIRENFRQLLQVHWLGVSAIFFEVLKLRYLIVCKSFGELEHNHSSSPSSSRPY